MGDFIVWATKVVRGALPALGGIAVLASVFVNVLGSARPIGWNDVGLLAAGAGLAFAATAMLRFALKRQTAVAVAEGPSADPNIVERGRIGPLILGVGSAAILLLALGLIVAFTLIAHFDPFSTIADKLDTLLMGVFTAVLPVFATWVGTVLAFYFTKESFAQAARSALDLSSASGPQQLVTDVNRMIPYDGIGKLVVDRANVMKTSMDDVISLFNDNTTRVVIFERNRQPIFVIRNKLVPQAWIDAINNKQPSGSGKCIRDYLEQNGGTVATDAAQYGFVSSASTVDQARAQMLQAKCADLFVTDTGQKTAPVLGWLPDDRLK